MLNDDIDAIESSKTGGCAGDGRGGGRADASKEETETMKDGERGGSGGGGSKLNYISTITLSPARKSLRL